MGELLIAEKQDLQDIANKLKVKTGKTDGMSFPNGFMEAIDDISGENTKQSIKSSLTVKLSDVKRSFISCLNKRELYSNMFITIGGN